jgi:hypothetical protein
MNKTTIYVDSNFDFKPLAEFSSTDYEVSITCSFSALTSLFNIIVFSHPNLKDPTFKILLLVSLVDFCYMTLVMYNGTVAAKCDQSPILCGEQGQIAGYMGILIVNNYFNSCLAIFNIMMEIYLSVNRLLLIQNITLIKDVTVRTVGPIFGSLALIYYLPSLFANRLDKTGKVYVYRNQTFVDYALVLTEFGSSPVGQWVTSAIQILRIVLVVLVIFPINIVSIFLFQKYLSRKMTMTHLTLRASVHPTQPSAIHTNNIVSQHGVSASTIDHSTSHEASRNVTLMLISVSFLYVIGTIPYMAVMIILFTNAPVNGEVLYYLILIAYFALLTFPGLKFFVYFLFNRLFRQQVSNYLRSLRNLFVRSE